MKKVSGIIVFVIGLVLIGLNYSYNTNPGFKLTVKNTDVEQVNENDIKSEESAFDVSKINLPSVFDLLSKLI